MGVQVDRSTKSLAASAAAVLLCPSAPAAAERIETYWLLAPAAASSDGVAKRGEEILEQRLLPARLARLVEPVAVGDTTLPAGTFLYMVFNAAGRVGYCTLKNRSAGRQARTLFIPALDRRPCFADHDRDGRFDATFTVFDKYGGPPTVRGSIDGATPLARGAAFSIVDRRSFPLDMRMSLRFVGSTKEASKAFVAVRFNGAIAGDWQEVRGFTSPAGQVFDVGNVRLLLSGFSDGAAVYKAVLAPDVYISSDNRNTLFFGPLPPLR